MKNFLNKDIRIKVISIIFAFFMWVYVMAEDDPIVSRTMNKIPVTIDNVQEIEANELVLSPGNKLEASITVRGRGKAISAAANEGITLHGVIVDPVKGDNEMVLQTNLNSANLEFTINPSNLVVNLDTHALVQKTVEVHQMGTMENNFIIEEIVTSPTQIYVEGPKTLVDQVSSLKVDVDITESKVNFSKKLPVIPVDNEGNQIAGVTLSTDSVFVHATVLATKLVPINLNLFETMEGDIRLGGYTLNPDQILIKGTEARIQSINEISTTMIDSNTLTASSDGTHRIPLVFPEGITSDVKEVILNVTLEKLISKEYNISKDRIQIRGDSQLLNISENANIPDEINVVILFANEQDSEITEDDFILYVTLQEYESNPASVPLHIDLEHPNEKVEILPSVLNFTGQ